ncbi:MAG TPA: FAD-dependent oxidoreductase [Streptosporangiaceae bacterium]|nr:FAD-dependent oxidoreductase [Streptosporangiaceae bacterium]
MRLIVVGSGIVGASCAQAASAAGCEVVLVDATLPGRATAAGAGIICPWSSRVDDPAWYSFACAAARQYPELIGRLAELGETDVGYRQVGALALASSEEDQERTRRLLLDRRTAAPEMGDVHNVSDEEAQRLFPPLRAGANAVYIAGAARVDGRLLAGALARVAVTQGAILKAGQARLAFRSGRAAGVTVDGELIEGDAVVSATGAWTGSFLQEAGLDVRVEAQRGQIMHISLAPADTGHWPVVLPGAGGHYMLAFDDSRIVAGATRETGSGFDYRVTPAGLAEILGQALAAAPGLASGTYLETRIGFRPMGPDIRPLLGPVAGLEGLVVATGLGASGLTMGPYAGAIAAQVAMGLPSPVDLAPFEPLR